MVSLPSGLIREVSMQLAWGMVELKWSHYRMVRQVSLCHPLI